MKTLFNDGWQFAELPLNKDSMYKDGKIVLFNPDQFFDKADCQEYKDVRVPHDWQIHHVKELYK
ncbi:MAG: hypothetical protein J6Y16_01285, partial [Treponema sp.]|nr:hypothetical protein [Treponema sp.]